MSVKVSALIGNGILDIPINKAYLGTSFIFTGSTAFNTSGESSAAENTITTIRDATLDLNAKLFLDVSKKQVLARQCCFAHDGNCKLCSKQR